MNVNKIGIFIKELRKEKAKPCQAIKVSKGKAWLGKKMVSTQSARQDDHAGVAGKGVGDKKWGNERMMVEC